MNDERITLSGMGGQGIILLGTLMANCAMDEGRHVTLIPSYGAEMRGGLSRSFLTLSEKPVLSPAFAQADSAILMYQPALEKYEKSVRKEGVLIYNENMVLEKPKRSDCEVIPVPANRKAQEAGSLRSANIIMLGVWCKKRDLFKYETVVRALRNIFQNKKAEVIDLNLRALESGYNYLP